MLQDVGTAEQQKLQKQGRDDHIKQVYNPLQGSISIIRVYRKEICGEFVFM